MGNPNVLLAEGNDDKHVLAKFVEDCREPNIEIVDSGGVDGLLEDLPVRLKQSDLARLGVVIDADLDLDARYKSIVSILRSHGYKPIPRRPDVAGTVVVTDGLPPFGIWLMPDNTVPGMLEDFARTLIPTQDGLLPRVEDCLDEIPGAERLFPAAHLAKARIHTWLAWQERPGVPMGLAIRMRVLDKSLPIGTAFLAWLDRLYG